MSGPNLELQRRAAEAWSGGDLDAFLTFAHPDIEWHTGGGFLGLDAVYLGQDGIRKFERDFRGMWESMTMTVEELRDNGDRVAVRATFHAVGRDGLQVSGPISWVTTWSDGLALRVDVTGDWESALEGLA